MDNRLKEASSRRAAFSASASPRIADASAHASPHIAAGRRSFRASFSAAAAFLLGAALLFTGCYDALFSRIRDEVELESADVSGAINSIVRFQNTDGTEYLFLQNGKIKYKKADVHSHGAWETDGYFKYMSYDYWNENFSGTYFMKVAADSEYVYALGAEYDQDDDEGENVPDTVKLYCLSAVGGEWQEVSAVNEKIAAYLSALISDYDIDDLYDDKHYSIHLFCTNAPQNGHRKAYIRIGNGTDKAKTAEIYELSGASTSCDSAVTENGAGRNTLSAAYFNGDFHFFGWPDSDGDYNYNYIAVATNETKDDKATYVYYGVGEYLYWFAVSDYSDEFVTLWAAGSQPSATGKIDTGSYDVVSIAATSDALLVGTGDYLGSGNGNGVYRVALTDGKPAAGTSSFDTNADSVMGKPYHVLTLLAVSPDKTETEGDLYASVNFKGTESSSTGDYESRGLWSYYPTRGNWNRE